MEPDRYISELLPSILRDYHNKYDLKTVPIKVDRLRELISERGVVDRIFWEKFLYDSTVVAAKVEFYIGYMGAYSGDGDYARIQYSQNLNDCWVRFVVLKEMIHCVIDGAENQRVSNLNDLAKLSEMLVSESFNTIVPEEFLPHTSENWAEILALEILFPMELRSHFKSDYDAGTITDIVLAKRFMIPEAFIRTAMADGYYKAMYSLRADSLVNINDSDAVAAE